MRVQDTSSALFGLDIALFWSKVDRGAPDDCWLWTAGRSEGYGSVGWEFQGRSRYTRAHRAAWILTYGEVPKGLCVCHKCDTRPCCNPSHFFLGTRTENQADMKAKGRGRAGRTILTAAQVQIIRRECMDGTATRGELAQRYGVKPGTVSAIVLGKRWRSIPRHTATEI